MKYEGPLYGKVRRRYIPLQQTSEDVDRMKKEAVEVEYLVRNWVNDSTELANMPLREMVLYALREENIGKIEAINKAEKAETRTERLLRVEMRSQPWTETPTILVKVVADAKALNMNPQAFCKIIAEELVGQIQQQTSHF